MQDALDDPSAGVRRHAVRLAEYFVEDAPRLQARLLQLAKDPSREVRYQLAFTLGELEIPARLTALQTVVGKDPTDPWIRMAALSSLQRNGGQMFQALAAEGGVSRFRGWSRVPAGAGKAGGGCQPERRGGRSSQGN